jgi:hypothetical protein
MNTKRKYIDKIVWLFGGRISTLFHIEKVYQRCQYIKNGVCVVTHTTPLKDG